MQLYLYPVKLFVLLIEIDKSIQAFVFLCWVFVINLLLGYLCMPSIAGMNTLCCLKSDYLEVVKACVSEYYIATESRFRLFTSALCVYGGAKITAGLGIQFAVHKACESLNGYL